MGDLWRKCLWQGSQSQAYKDVFTASSGTDCPCGLRSYNRTWLSKGKLPHVAAKMATRDGDAGRYQRRRPEQTHLYRLVEEYYPAFTTYLAEQGKELPGYMQREFEDYLKRGCLEHGFLRVHCASCHAEHLVALAANEEASVPVAARGAWPKVRHCWWMRYCLSSPCASGR